jgi:DNA repair ATPase RecN
VTGKNVSEVQSNLESTLKIMKKFEAVSISLENWLGSTSYQLSSIEIDSTNIEKLSNFIGETYIDMMKHKRSYLELYKMYEDISVLNNSEQLVGDLEKHIESLETQWKEIENEIKHQYSQLCPDMPLESTSPTDINTQLKTRYV